jgi:heme/copper-type cytochrome/quinol oxidase subunit 2
MDKVEVTNAMDKRIDFYLVVLSILLGISVLKTTEVFQLAEQLKTVLNSSIKQGVSVALIGVFLFTAAYLIFFALMGITIYMIVRQLQAGEGAVASPALGTNVALCIGSLVVSYLIIFSLAIYGLAGQIQLPH